MVGNFAVGCGRLSVEQWFTTGKAILDAMPVVDAWFADLPTEENDFRAEHAGKINQALLDSLADATIAIDLLEPTLDLPDQFCDFTIVAEPVHQIRRLRVEPFFANDRFAGALEPANILQNLLHQYAHLRQQVICFINRKQSWKASIHRSPAAGLDPCSFAHLTQERDIVRMA